MEAHSERRNNPPPPATDRHSAAARRRVLIVALYYAPGNASGSLRMVKLTKYLARYGWDASVLTAPTARYATSDPALLLELPRSTRIYRAPCWDAQVAFGVRGKYPALVEVPDRYVSWLPGGVWTGLRIMRTDRVDAVLSTSPVPTAHLIGRTLTALRRTPWIADFRDPWPHAEHRTRLRRGVERRLEALVLRHADRVLASTPEILAALTAHDPRVGRKGHVLYNGYDEDDIGSIDVSADTETDFVLLHTGLLHRDYRNPSALLIAVQRCLQRGVLPPSARVNLMAGGEDGMAALVEDLRLTLGLADRVQIGGRLPHRQSVAAMSAASVLVLLQGERMLPQVPAKTFEYLRSGRPILALAPAHSATAQFVRGFAGVYLAAPDDVAAIEQRLGEIADAWRGGLRFFARRDAVRRFTREAAARELAQILTAVSGELNGVRLARRTV